MYKGVISALVTPFRDEKLDFEKYGKLIDLQVAAGVTGIVVAGSTGEGNSLLQDEWLELIEFAKARASGKIKVIVGISSTSTIESLNKVKSVATIDVDGLMTTVPYYTKPNQDGILQHFQVLHEGSNLPLMIYVHPGRTGIDVNDATIMELAKLERVKAIKDAGSDIERPLRMKVKLSDRLGFLTGNDTHYIAYAANGGAGIVSALSGIMPKIFVKMQQLIDSNDFAGAQALQAELWPIYDELYVDTNPIGPKTLAAFMYDIAEEFRLPLVPAASENRQKLAKLAKLAFELEQRF